MARPNRVGDDRSRATPIPVAQPTDSFAMRRIDELVIGHQLRFPIYDVRGVLLLAAGAVISRTFKELLASRHVEAVRMRSEDAESIVPRRVAPRGAASALTLETPQTRRLDSLIEVGALYVANSGPPVKTGLVMHGCRPYAAERRQILIEQYRASTQLLGAMLQTAAAGGPLRGADLAAVAETYLQELTADGDQVVSSTIGAERDPELTERCLRLAVLGMAIGIELGLDEENVRLLGLCGLVHDWGLSQVPLEIRYARRSMNADELREYKRHPIYSMEMLQEACEIPWIVPLVCYQVHEKPNGTGYPRHRTGPAIHVFAKILHVADAYLTLLTTSFARPPMSPYRALEYLLKQVRTGAVDRDAVRGLLQTVSLFPVGSQIVLSDGSLACVLRRNPGNYMRPIVALIRDAHGQVLEANKFLIDLAASPLGVEQALDAPAPPEPEPAMSEVADAALAAR